MLFPKKEPLAEMFFTGTAFYAVIRQRKERMKTVPGTSMKNGTGFSLKQAALLAALCVVTALAPLPAHGRAEPGAWEYLWGDRTEPDRAADPVPAGPWQTATSPLDPPGRGLNTVLWLRVPVPALNEAQPPVYFDCVYYDFDAFYRGRLLYRYPAGSDAVAFHGRPWHIVPLPAGAGGDRLYLRVRSTRPEIGIPGAVRFGGYSGHVTGIIRGDQLRATVALLLVLAGALALLRGAGRRADRSLLWGGCALVLLGIWNIGNTRIKLLYLNEPPLWLYAEHASLYFSPVAIGLFLERIFGRGPGSSVRRGWQFLLACAIAFMAVSVYDPYWLRAYTLRPFQVLLALYLVVVCAFITREALRGDIDARIAASGLAAAIATGLYDIAVSFLGLSFILPKVSYLGLLAFIASLGMVMDRRLRVVPAKLLSFSTTREGTDSGAPVGDQQEKKSAPAAITPDIRAKLEQAISYLKEHYTEDVSREGLAALIGMNHDYFGKMFISYTGKKFSSYINELRITKAAGILTTTDQNIVNIAFSVGYESLSTFYRAFQGVTGLSPLAYRERFSNNPPEN